MKSPLLLGFLLILKCLICVSGGGDAVAVSYGGGTAIANGDDCKSRYRSHRAFLKKFNKLLQHFPSSPFDHRKLRKFQHIHPEPGRNGEVVSEAASNPSSVVFDPQSAVSSIGRRGVITTSSIGRQGIITTKVIGRKAAVTISSSDRRNNVPKSPNDRRSILPESAIGNKHSIAVTSDDRNPDMPIPENSHNHDLSDSLMNGLKPFDSRRHIIPKPSIDHGHAMSESTNDHRHVTPKPLIGASQGAPEPLIGPVHNIPEQTNTRTRTVPDPSIGRHHMNSVPSNHVIPESSVNRNPISKQSDNRNHIIPEPPIHQRYHIPKPFINHRDIDNEPRTDHNRVAHKLPRGQINVIPKSPTDPGRYIRNISSGRSHVIPESTNFLASPNRRFETDTCDKGWYNYQDSCYYISDAKLSWWKSSLKCSYFGGYLAIITDQDENRHVRNWYMQKCSNDDGAWIGLNKALFPTHKHWYWGSDKTQCSWFHWKRHEKGYHFNGDDCAFLSGNGWVKANCDYNRFFICEKKMGGP